MEETLEVAPNLLYVMTRMSVWVMSRHWVMSHTTHDVTPLSHVTWLVWVMSRHVNQSSYTWMRHDSYELCHVSESCHTQRMTSRHWVISLDSSESCHLMSIRHVTHECVMTRMSHVTWLVEDMSRHVNQSWCIHSHVTHECVMPRMSHVTSCQSVMSHMHASWLVWVMSLVSSESRHTWTKHVSHNTQHAHQPFFSKHAWMSHGIINPFFQTRMNESWHTQPLFPNTHEWVMA